MKQSDKEVKHTPGIQFRLFDEENNKFVSHGSEFEETAKDLKTNKTKTKK